MKHSLTLLLFSALALAGCDGQNKDGGDSSDSGGASGASDNIVAVVNGVELPASRIAIYAQLPAEAVSEEQRKIIIDNMIISELIAQKAVEEGYADRPEIQDELAVARQAVLGRAYAEEFLDANPLDAARLDELYAEFSELIEYEVAHILIEDEEAAKAALAEIKEDPGKFAELAREKSSDPGSAANDGKLGWVSPGALVPEFAAAMEALDEGEISEELVKTQFGWHIIRVDDTREQEAPELTDQLREQLSQQARAELLTEHLEALREQAEVEIFDNAGETR